MLHSPFNPIAGSAAILPKAQKAGVVLSEIGFGLLVKSRESMPGSLLNSAPIASICVAPPAEQKKVLTLNVLLFLLLASNPSIQLRKLRIQFLRSGE